MLASAGFVRRFGASALRSAARLARYKSSSRSVCVCVCVYVYVSIVTSGCSERLSLLERILSFACELSRQNKMELLLLVCRRFSFCFLL